MSREILAASLDDLLVVAKQRESPKLMAQCRKLREKLNNSHFNLLVLGEFKRGKSTLINALLGAEVLPSATIPLTSIVTVVSFAETPSLKISFLNGEEKSDSLDKLAEYVTERDNPNNERGVNTVNVYYPAPLLQAGIRIIDTPGTGSVFTHNTQATLDFLPEADAAIFVFASDQPATRAELELLRTTRQFSVKEFLVLNKIDHLDEASRNESMQFLKRTLDKELEQDCPVYGISARRALLQKTGKAEKDTGETFYAFEEAIEQYFQSSKNEALMRSIGQKTQALLKEIGDLIALEMAAMNMAPAQLSEALAKFHEAGAALLDEHTDAKYIVGGEIRQLLTVIEGDLKEVVAAHEDGLRETIDAEFESNASMSKEQLIETLRASLRTHITEIFNAWVKDEDLKISRRFEVLNGRFVDKANDTVAKIALVTEKIFNVQVNTHFDIEKLTTKSRHFYAVAHPFSLALEMTPLLLPGFLAKKIIKRKFLHASHHELSKNAGRLRADYQERIELSAHQFLDHFHEKVVGALAEIEGAVSRAVALKAEKDVDKAAFEKAIAEQREVLEGVGRMLGG